ncbi:MAG: hypothetical protein EZS28_033447 [Streblomastix strix]|uniref:Uncharacterized protein n=1 Tax=Streblomastix strix TaxID=222440 RepID=A0A5J4UK20_9EUKA|nr:MAG: hypothetical protein EZS28_033447 [Streblomastix strix]
MWMQPYHSLHTNVFASAQYGWVVTSSFYAWIALYTEGAGPLVITIYWITYVAVTFFTTFFVAVYARKIYLARCGITYDFRIPVLPNVQFNSKSRPLFAEVRQCKYSTFRGFVYETTDVITEQELKAAYDRKELKKNALKWKKEQEQAKLSITKFMETGNRKASQFSQNEGSLIENENQQSGSEDEAEQDWVREKRELDERKLKTGMRSISQQPSRLHILTNKYRPECAARRTSCLQSNSYKNRITNCVKGMKIIKAKRDKALNTAYAPSQQGTSGYISHIPFPELKSQSTIMNIIVIIVIYLINSF